MPIIDFIWLVLGFTMFMISTLPPFLAHPTPCFVLHLSLMMESNDT